MQKKKIDDADWSVTIVTWTFYPQDFSSFILLKRRRSDHWYNTYDAEENGQRHRDSVYTYETSEREKEFDQLENIPRIDEHLGK